MKRISKIFCLILVVTLLFSSMIGCSKEVSKEKEVKEYSIKLDIEYNGKEIDLSEAIVRKYINNKDNEARLAFMLDEQLNKTQETRVFGDKQKIQFSWKSTGKSESFTLHFSSDENFNNELFTYTTKKNVVDELGVFVPGEKYYYKVIGTESGESKIDSFVAKDSPVRFISAGAILNMRDIGGWTAEDGKKVKYGMIYRGAALDGTEHPSGEQYILERGTSRLDEMGYKVFNEYLKIKSEIDLRGVKGDQHTLTAFSNEPRVCQVPDVGISTVWGSPNDSKLKSAIKTYFSFLADENNYPVYFHCNGGADRTGALAFLINGLLGVDYADLAIDYELTSYSFAAGGIRKRSEIITPKNDLPYFGEPDSSDPTCGYCKKTLLSMYRTNDLQQAIESYLKDCGVTSSQISKIKSIMLVG